MSDTLMQRLVEWEKGLVFLSAPTKGGKTRLIKVVRTRRPRAVIISGEQLAEAIMVRIETEGKTDPLEQLADCTFIGVEDIDWYSEKSQTQREMAAVMSRLAEKALVVATGIDLKNRMAPLFSELDAYAFFEKTDANGEWKQG